MKRKLRMGMVGGGRGAFIGSVHRMAARLDGTIELACGAFSSNPERSRASGADLLLPENRVYGDYREMIEREAVLPADEKMDFVAIVTPNDCHHGPAKLALEAGFPVMCDKPLCLNMDEAKELEAAVEKTGLLFGLTHNYTGYPMVKEARQRVRAGELGKIRRVVAEYPQAWLATRLESTGQKQANWRTDPKRAGASCCVGDIGTHAANLTEYVTGLPIEEVAAELSTFVDGRPLDDDASVLLRLADGARGVLWASQVAIDEENGLNLRVYGEKGSLEWASGRAQHAVVEVARQASRGRARRCELRSAVSRIARRDPASRRPPGRLPRRFRESLPELCLGASRRQRAGRDRLPDGERRRARDGVHRGHRVELEPRCEVDQNPRLTSCDRICDRAYERSALSPDTRR